MNKNCWINFLFCWHDKCMCSLSDYFEIELYSLVNSTTLFSFIQPLRAIMIKTDRLHPYPNFDMNQSPMQ